MYNTYLVITIITKTRSREQKKKTQKTCTLLCETKQRAKMNRKKEKLLDHSEGYEKTNEDAVEK